MTLRWAPLMEPSAAAAIVGRVGELDGVLAAPLFAALYVGIWVPAGLAGHAVYRPPGAVAAGAVAAGALVSAGRPYEFTPFKRACGARCRQRLRSGLTLGRACVGSSLGSC